MAATVSPRPKDPMTMRRDYQEEYTPKKPTLWSREKALERTADLCSRSEQCEADLRGKMRQHQVPAADQDAVIDYLYDHKFLDQSRYARAYVHDKLAYNRWGRTKIRLMLRTKRLDPQVVEEALEAIDPQEYFAVLLKQVGLAARSANLEDYNSRAKILRKFYAQGFETSLITKALDRLRSDCDD